MRLLLLLAILIPSPAFADLTATFGAPNLAFTMTVEVASNGDVRGDVGEPGSYFITRSGHGYFVQTVASRLVVMRVEDMATVMSEQMTKLDPQFREQMEQHAPKLKLIEKGSATINGRSGKAYFMQAGDGRVSPAPVVVMSPDPTLAPLGEAMARQFDMSMAMTAQTIGTASFKDMQSVLKTGAPLRFAGAELRSVVFGPIAAARFELPNPPETLDGVRAAMTPSPTKP